MMRRVLIVFGILTICMASSEAQQITNWCHAHSKWDERAAEDPSLLIKRDQYKASIKSYIASHYSANKTGEPVLVIPIVFHIIHDNGPENISENTVQSAIDFMNRDFRKDNADSVNVVLPFRNFHPDTRIEFRRARLDPDGKCSNGITRTQSSMTSGADDGVKNLVRWDNEKYLNIWVVRNIGSGAGGYSYTPPVNDNIDGIVVRYGQLSALSHEAGHWLGLNHPWGPSNDANASGNCSLDDDIDDTPNTLGQSFCSTSRNSCTDVTYVDTAGVTYWTGDVIDNAQNIMDYGFCSAENFTNGQMDYVRATLNNSVNGRNNLWTPTNRLETGTEDGHSIVTCPPTADFASNTQIVCQGENVLFADESFGETVHSYAWDFEGGTPATSSATNPSIIYNTPGIYQVTLAVTNNTYGSDTTTRTSYIEVIGTDQSLPSPYGEGFESDDIFNNLDESWSLVNTSTSGWIQNSFASSTGNQSVRVKNSSIPTGESSSIISPYLDFSTVMNCNTITFRHAYAQKTAFDNDVLKVMISTDCGKSWDVAYFVSGGQLATTSDLISYSYVPQSDDEWRETEINISSYVGDDHVLVRFEAISGAGNIIYVDDINIGCADASNFLDVTEEFTNNAFNVHPNPSSGSFNVEFNTGVVENLTMEVFNSIGKQVYSRNILSTPGANNVLIPSQELEGKGVYFLSIKSENSGSRQGQTHFYKKIIQF